MSQNRSPDETKWYFALNENKDMAYQNMLNATNAALREKFITIKSIYFKKWKFKYQWCHYSPQKNRVKIYSLPASYPKNVVERNLIK